VFYRWERLLRICDVVLAADFGSELFALFGLLQDGADLLVPELTFLHTSIPPFGSILTMPMVQFLGEGQDQMHEMCLLLFLHQHNNNCLI